MIKFYKCKHCGTLVEVITDKAVPVCCGEKMTELVPNTVDAAKEKHVPDVSFEKGLVIINVGTVPHPMTEEHYIEWIELETTGGVKRHHLNPGDVPTARFAVTEDEDPVAAYAYCNLHGLWMAAI